MVEVYFWEGDPEAEELLEELKQRGLEFRGHNLDPEVPNSAPRVEAEGRTFWSLEEYRRSLPPR